MARTISTPVVQKAHPQIESSLSQLCEAEADQAEHHIFNLDENLETVSEVHREVGPQSKTSSDVLNTFIMMQLKLKYLHAVPSSTVDACTSEIIQLLKVYSEYLTLLETVGLQIKVDGVTEVFRGTATMIVADNLASHGIGGFNESFSGFRICRFCMCTSQELSYGYPPRNILERSSSSYDEHVKLVENDNQLRTTYGIRKNSPFNDLKYYHVTRGLPPDLAHDLFEGICPDTLGKVLTHFIDVKLVSIEKINEIIDSFPYQLSDKSVSLHQYLGTVAM
ncbi:hypothetical protein BSL78_24226 [Apostichopus japonicus]|uniref:Uncharacterized protein n=1 Tax=Stichopus japonicus TaxID=307972 RepID=A0A2G8JT42_STIJA|nr:hypothetical protein BSL78_24226 [Apostichopus japonicus]